MRKKLLGLLRLAPIALLLVAGVASAQTTGTLVGTVTDAATGKPVAGALVIATSPALQGEQTAVTDSGGSYTLTVLPPGRYKLAVQLAGYKPAERTDIVLRVDFTLRANIAIVPEAVQMDEQVVKTGMAPAINIGTAEAGTVLSREFLATVPTTRTFEGSTVIAPTAQVDYFGISFAGATSPENNYIIDGMRVSDPQFGANGTNLLNNFVEQLDVKVGSFMPEYGFSSAGIINTVTKSGSNEFHGSFWGSIEPGFLSPQSPATWRNGQAISTFRSPYKGAYDADFGLEVGGPIVKDKLWFYAGFAPQLTYTVRTFNYQTRVPTAATANLPINQQVAQTDPTTGQFIMQTLPNSEAVYGNGFDRYFAIGKLTWLINENNSLFVAFNTQPGTQYGVTGTTGNLSAISNQIGLNSTNAILNYSGKFLDKHLLLQLSGGYYYSTYKNNDFNVNGVDMNNTPNIQWDNIMRLGNFIPSVAASCPSVPGNPGVRPGCYVQQYRTGGNGYTEDTSTSRWAADLSLTGLFNLGGQHQLKGGIQFDYAQLKSSRYYSGGYYWRARSAYAENIGDGGTGARFQINRGFGTPAGTNLGFFPATGAEHWTSFNSGPGNEGGIDPANPYISTVATNTLSMGYYLQDSWTIANVLTLNFGVRLDTQNIKVGDATPPPDPTTPEISLTNNWAPRVQAIWDFTGNGRGKIQGNWGYYYEAVPLRIAERGLYGEPSVVGNYQLNSCRATDLNGNPLAGSPNSNGNPASACQNVYGLNVGQGPGVNAAGQQVGNAVNLSTQRSSNPGFFFIGAGYAPVAPDLKGQYTQQFGGGIQYEVLQDLAVGVDYMGRRLGAIIEDMSSDDGGTYFIANPAESNPWTVTQAGNPYQGVTFNPKQVVAYDPTTGMAYAQGWPKPKRSFDGITFTVSKNFSKRWLAQASYTYSVSQGNYGGLFKSETGQLDPNLSSDYDLVPLLGNKTGPLYGTSNNQVKVAGSYTHELSPSVLLTGGANFSALSGQPMNAYSSHPVYGDGEAFVIPRGMPGNLPWLVNLNLSGQVVWNISGPYQLKFLLDVFNILNLQTVTMVDQIWTFDFVNPLQNAQCSAKNAVGQKNPVNALLADCPDLAYAKTWDNRPATINRNFGQPQTSGFVNAYQLPVRVRLGVQLSF